jgi:hypothetical protein
MPGLLTEAHRRATGESDNLSVVAMTWENQDDARVADTQSLDDEQFATSTNTRDARHPVPVRRRDRRGHRARHREIQNAIKKVPR